MVCDPLVYDASIGGVIAAKILRVKTVAVITDIPVYIEAIEKTKVTVLSKLSKLLKRKIIDSLFDSFNGYVFLTESMNSLCNKYNKPYVIIEGIVKEEKNEDLVERPRNKNTKKIIIYAGGLHEKFGIGTLVDAMSEVNDESIELHLYGEGEYINTLEKQNKLPKNVKYCGMVETDVVYEKEKDADLLINPRPSSEDFTKYSFPSKTVEYMSTGTPVLTTKLEGIPKDYFPYLYFIEEETSRGIAESIMEIMNLPSEMYVTKGREAKEFVITQKNAIEQAGKLIGLLRKS